jgi:hypothetical protein
MSARVRRRKIKWFHKLATPMYEMERPESSMSEPERMQQSFESGQNPGRNIPICDWNDSIILDVFGLVPIAGDALDLGRSFVYINCGQYFDGVLGLAMAAPVIGAAATGIKWISKIPATGKVKDIFFRMADALKSSGVYSKIEDAISAVKKYILESFNNMKDAVESIKNLISDNYSVVKQNFDKFDLFLNKELSIDKEAYLLWKNKSLSSVQRYKPTRSAIDKLDFLNLPKLSVSNIKKGAQKIEDYLSKIYLNFLAAYIDAKRSRLLSEIESVRDIESLKDYISEYEKLAPKNYALFRLGEAESLKFYKSRAKSIIDFALDSEKTKNYSIIKNIRKAATINISKQYDVFFRNITSKSYISFIKNSVLKNKPDVNMKNLIEEFLKSSEGITVRIFNSKDLQGYQGYYEHGANFAKVVAKYLRVDDTISHELMHAFDNQFLKFLKEKGLVKTNKRYLSDFMMDNVTYKAFKSSKEAKDIISRNILYEGYYTGFKNKDDYIDYITYPTELFSYIGEVKTHIMSNADKYFETGRPYRYPTIEDVLHLYDQNKEFYKWASQEVPIHNIFKMFDSIDEIYNIYGEQAYRLFKMDNMKDKSGDFLLDFLKTLGL